MYVSHRLQLQATCCTDSYVALLYMLYCPLDRQLLDSCRGYVSVPSLLFELLLRLHVRRSVTVAVADDETCVSPER